MLGPGSTAGSGKNRGRIMNKNNLIAAGALALFCLVQTAQAAVSVKEADQLKGDLTPLGGERSGNGSDIPPWRGGLTLPPESYKKPGQHHPDPYPQDKPLFEITAANMNQFEKFLRVV